jgi:inosine-uridine nucleoside N-ribohydrolase
MPASISRPTIAVGMTTALDGSMLDATDFHGEDGLGNVHKHLPHHTAPTEWAALFQNAVATEQAAAAEAHEQLPFVPSAAPSYDEILHVLQQEPAGTVTIVALGPLMNVARAAAADPTTFARVRRVISMGGTLRLPGNVTPYAEFNVFSDAQAAAAVYNLTGVAINSADEGAPPRGLDLTIFPLDITSRHFLAEPDYVALLAARGLQSNPADVHKLVPLADAAGAVAVPPLLEWCHAWLTTTFATMRHIYGHDLMTPEERAAAGPVVIEMHDPLALWYAIQQDTATADDDNTGSNGGSSSSSATGWTVEPGLDIRVETLGEFTRGMTVHDTRGRAKRSEPTKNDFGQWLLASHGNAVSVARESPYQDGEFGRVLLETVFGPYRT